MAKEATIEWLIVPDIDPDASLCTLAFWIIEAIEAGELYFSKHTDWPKLRNNALKMAVEMSKFEGQILGSQQIFDSLNLISVEIDAQIHNKKLILNNIYELSRQDFIRKTCEILLQATQMAREIPKRSRPIKLLPDYGILTDENTSRDARLKLVRDAWEFSIANTVAQEKAKTGKLTGLKKLVDEAISDGRLPGDGEEFSRIKRLANKIHRYATLYLPPTIRALHARALERVKKSVDIMTS